MDESELRNRMDQFGEELRQARDVINELKTALIGSMAGGTGLIQRQKMIEDRIADLTTKLMELVTRVQRFEEYRFKAIGIWMALTGTLAVIPFIFKWLGK